MDIFHFDIMFWMNMLLNKTTTKVSELLETLLPELVVAVIAGLGMLLRNSLVWCSLLIITPSW